MIPLAILCAVLVAVIARQRRSLRVAREMNAAFEERGAGLWKRLEADDTLIAEAYALLHDERHKGKMGNQKAWQAARDEWDAKVKGVKA